LQQANIPYLIGDYEQVIKILDQLPLANNENPVVDFYKGASLQNLGKYDDAILAYSKVLNHGDNLFLEEAEWYRCLCYLKMGNKVTARNELLAVLKRNGHFESDAKVLLRRLKYFMK
jgi:tetratricopeptide (TPR) repeat protein